MNRLPLRIQLVLALLALVAVALLITGVAGTGALKGYLLERVDDQLHNTVRGAMQSGRLPNGLNGGGRDGNGPFGPALTEAFYSMVVDQNGDGSGVLRSATDSSQSPPKLPKLDLVRAEAHDDKPFTVGAVSTGADWRVLVETLPDDSGAIIVASSLEDVGRTIHRLQLIQLVISIVVLIAMGLAGYAIVRSSLRKLVRVEKTAAAIAAGDLTQRVDGENDGTEIGRLAAALNTMLSQIETAFTAQRMSEADARASEERMRRFVADASHELRTPLTSIRGFAELQRQAAVVMDLDERNRLTGRIEAEAKRMGMLVEDLLLLARLDQQRPLESEPVEVQSLVNDVVLDAPAMSGDHVVTFIPDDTGGPAVVTGDPSRLRQVILNLLANAYAHTPPGTHVEVCIKTTESDVMIDVSDDGPGMPPEDAARVFERFYRSDPSRTRASGGSGLGLSIVSALVSAHGGTIDLVTAPGAGARFSIRLPRTRTAENPAKTL